MHLQRALLVHGNWFYRRLAVLVQYSFYKNVASFSCQECNSIDILLVPESLPEHVAKYVGSFKKIN